jgi:hypothetical protein
MAWILEKDYTAAEVGAGQAPTAPSAIEVADEMELRRKDILRRYRE